MKTETGLKTDRGDLEMRLFISYSTGDLEIVNQIVEYLRPNAEVLYWDKDKEPGKEVWPTIFGWIDSVDTVIAIITDKTVGRAMAVGNEIGHARAKGKKIVPLVADNVPSTELGCLNGITYVPFSRENLQTAMHDVARSVLGEELKLPRKKAVVQKKPEPDRTLLVILGILGLLAIFSGNQDEDEYY